MSATYLCPACRATFSADEAQAADFLCPACQGAYLVARPGPACLVRAVLPEAVEAPLPPLEPAVKQAETPPSQPGAADMLLAAARRQAEAPALKVLLAESPGKSAAGARVGNMALQPEVDLGMPERAPTAPTHSAGQGGEEAAAGPTAVESAPQAESPVTPGCRGFRGEAGAAGVIPTNAESTFSSGIRCAAVLPPPQNHKDATAVEQLIGTLAKLGAPVSLEIAGSAQGRQLLIRGAPDAESTFTSGGRRFSVVGHVAAQLYAVYDQVAVTPLAAEADPAERMMRAGALAGARLRLAGPEFLPIKTWREFGEGDPLVAILGAFGGLQAGEHSLAQVIIHGAAPGGWADGYLEQLVNLKRRGYGGDAPMPTPHLLRGLVPLLAWLLAMGLFVWTWGRWERWLLAGPVLAGLALLTAWVLKFRNHWAGALEDEAAAKLKEQAFRVEVRLFAAAPDPASAQAILTRLVSAYRLFDTTSANRFEAVPLAEPNPTTLAPANGKTGRQAFALLNVKELSGLWHMPVGEALQMVERQTWERILPLPEAVGRRAGGAYLGVSRKGAQAIPVYLSPEALNRNIFIIGKTQYGKSTIMEHVCAEWMHDRERCVLVVDPHGDLARRAIGLVPPERVGDVIYVDLSDLTQSVSLNLLDVKNGADPDEVAEGFVNVGRALWQKYWGPRMLIPLGFGLRALATANLRRAADRQYTILSLAPLLMVKPEVRQALLNREVPLEDRPDIHNYFYGEFQDTSATQREQVISPVLSKAHAFERTPAIRNLVGQPRSTLDLYRAIRERKIIVLNTNSGKLGEDLSGFLGSLFLNVMRGVITQQTLLPREQRVRVSVVADEFQTMVGVDFGSLLGELQKNGGNFLVGTQSLDSLRGVEEGDLLPGRVFAGVATVVALQCNGSDARYLVESELDFKRLSPESPINLPPHTAYVKTVDARGNRVPVFSAEIAPPLAPDEEVIAGVMARRRAYTVPSTVAEHLARESIRRIEMEYVLVGEGAGQGDPQGTLSPARQPSSAADPAPAKNVPAKVARQAAQAIKHPPPESKEGRARAVPPPMPFMKALGMTVDDNAQS